MTEKLPLVSIAAVCYNHEKFLAETLNSIKDQTYPNIEVIILDDSSKDNSPEKIRQWLSDNELDWKFIAHTENQGLCKTLNESLSILNGKYYQMVACDDVLYPDKIEKQVEIFESSPQNISVLCGDLELIDDTGKLIAYDRNTFENDSIGYMDLLKESCVRTPSVLIRKSIFDRVGNYDEDHYFEDWDLWLRISRVSEIKKENRINVKYRMLSTSMYAKRRGGETLGTVFMIMQKQLPAPNKTQRDLIHMQFMRHIEHLYINKRKLYWLRIILANKFSFVPVFHCFNAILGIKYEHAKAITHKTKRVFKR